MQKKVLVLGTTNSVLSPMMAELIKHLTFKKVDVDSAGLTPRPIDKNVVKVLQEIGIDVSNFKPKSVNEFSHTKFDIIITTTEEARNFLQHMISSRTKIHKEFEDPNKAQGDEFHIINTFRKVRDEMNEWLTEFLSRHRLTPS